MKRPKNSPGTSGQVGPKSKNRKYRQHSEQARPSDRLRRDEDEAPPREDGPASDGKTAGTDKKAARDGKRLNKSKLRAEKTGTKLDAARERLSKQKPIKKPGPVKTAGRAVHFQAARYVHGKIHEVERENVGVEAAHKTELAGEKVIGGTTRFIKRRIRTRPTRQVHKWESRDIKAKADFQYRTIVQEHPEIKKDALSRFFQKQRIKRRYQKQAREAAKKGAKAAKKTAVTTEKIARAVAGFVKRHPVGVLIALGAFLLIVALHSCMTSMTTIGNGLIGAVGASTYPSEDADILFENDRGFALAENPNAPQPFVTWQFTEENGKRDYYWGHYIKNADTAANDYEARIADYQKSYGVAEKAARPAPEVYKYYSTQRPVDIGTFPKTENGPAKIVNFDKREEVENGRFRAWGYLLYAAPLTQKQMDDCELRAAPGNPDLQRLDEMVQTVGQWEEKRKVPDRLRLTWWYPDFGSFVKKEFVTPEQLEERHSYIVERQARAAQKRAEKKPIAERLKEGAAQAERDNSARPAPAKNTDKDR